MEKENKSSLYYKKFLYVIEKKLSVEDNVSLKDYAKQGCYFYIIFDNIDKNRFLFISPNHYEEKSQIYPETFNLKQISSKKDSILIKKCKTSFGELYYDVIYEGKPDISIILSDLTDSKKGDKIFRKYKTHTKKIAIDFPDWYLELIKSYNLESVKKKFKKEILCDNWYNEEIYDHFISTCFILEDRKLQRFNDHFIVLDEGKTGKSSLIGYLSAKADNISIAGLYGSSDSKAGKFRGGLVTLTRKTIIIDEVNELVESKYHNEKILSILNTILENGEYNYVKQFSAKIESSNQFALLGNVSDNFNFPLFLEGCVGNTLTIGRRIGMITYSTNLQGFKKGFTRDPTASGFVRAVQRYLSKILNHVLLNTQFLKKIFTHSQYNTLCNYYKSQLLIIKKDIEESDEVTKQFIASHAESIDRQIIRALKMYIYDNLDEYFSQKMKFYDNHLPFEILEGTKIQLDKNLLNFKNIVEHVKSSKITSRAEDYNNMNFDNLPQFYQNALKIFFENRWSITEGKGVSYYNLNKRESVKERIYAYKTGKRPVKSINESIIKYGCRISVILGKDVLFSFVNKNLFETKMNGIFKIKNINNKSEIIEKVWTEKSKPIDISDDSFEDLN